MTGVWHGVFVWGLLSGWVCPDTQMYKLYHDKKPRVEGMILKYFREQSVNV